jgi:hypothetical protein
LKPTGVFLVSTPNKLIYSDLHNYNNEFHLKEFYIPEFKEFLSARFKYVDLLGQKIEMGSYMAGLDGKRRSLTEYRIFYTEKGFRPTDEPRDIVYAVAVCSDKPLAKVSASFAMDLTWRMISSRDRQIGELTDRMAENELSVQALTAQVAEKEQAMQALTAQVAEKEHSVHTLMAQVMKKDRSLNTFSARVAEKDQSVRALSAQASEREQAVQTLSTQVAEQELEKQALNNKLSQSQEQVLSYALSKSWQITRPLRKLGHLMRGAKNA